ncbi:hypothetical protein ACWOCD_13510 [Enterococcus silesiacus]|uniref:hypothetical protein n=1 Tax=Enterococcus silesiacus TaxID=332949 RepID=UPI000900159F|nr:hypothetical protein [Enterococcus silesiacus]
MSKVAFGRVTTFGINVFNVKLSLKTFNIFLLIGLLADLLYQNFEIKLLRRWLLSYFKKEGEIMSTTTIVFICAAVAILGGVTVNKKRTKK